MDGWEQEMDEALRRMGMPGLEPPAPEAPPAAAARSGLTPATLRYLRTRQWIQSLLDQAGQPGAPPLNLARVLAALSAGAAPAQPGPAAAASPAVTGPVATPGSRWPQPMTVRTPEAPTAPPRVSRPTVMAPPQIVAPPSAGVPAPGWAETLTAGPSSRRSATGAAVTRVQLAEPRLATPVTPGGTATAKVRAPRPASAEESPSMRGVPMASRMANGIDAARQAGFSDDEILNYLTTGGLGPPGLRRKGKTLGDLLPADALLGPLPRDQVDQLRARLGAEKALDMIRDEAPRRQGDLFGNLGPGTPRQDTVDLLLLHPGWGLDDYRNKILNRHPALSQLALRDLWDWAHEWVQRRWPAPSRSQYGKAAQFSGPERGQKNPNASEGDDRQTWAQKTIVADPSLIMDFGRFRQSYYDAFGLNALVDTPQQNLWDLWHYASDLTRQRLRGAVNDSSTQEARNPTRGASLRRLGRTVVGDAILGGQDFMEGIINKIAPDLSQSPDVKAEKEGREGNTTQWMQGAPEDAMSGPWGGAITEEVGAQVRKRTPDAIKWALTTLASGTVGDVVAESAPVVKAAKVVAEETAPWIAKLLVEKLVKTPIDDAIWNNTLGEKDPAKTVQTWMALAQKGEGKTVAGAAKLWAWLRTPPGQVFAKKYGVTVQPEPGKEPIATYQLREPVTP